VFKAEGQSQIDLFMINNKNAVLLPSPGHLIAKSTLNLGFLADNALTNHDGFFYALLEKSAS
jgi:16S rRNA (cytosine967-C5)-methyltransferase